jgi:hypothetical protein
MFEDASDAVSMMTPYYEHGTLSVCYNWLTPIQKTIIAYGVARGLRYAQPRFSGFPRRLSTRNIFIDTDFRPYITDLALPPDPPMALTVIPQDPPYLAPEISRDYSSHFVWHVHRSITKADVFSYAMVLAEMSEGSLPQMKGVNRFKPFMLQPLLASGVRPMLPKTPPDFKSWIERLWATEPFKRPSFFDICRWMEEGQGWFPGSEAERQKFDAYKQYIDDTEVKMGRVSPLPESEALKWWRGLEYDEDPIPFSFIDLLIKSAPVEFDVMAFVSVLYAIGFKNWVKRSPLLAARAAAESLIPGITG